MSYAQDVLAKLKEKNASEPEFIQAATEVLTDRHNSGRYCKDI